MEKDIKNIEEISKEKPVICIREINENINRVKLGEPLTKPLKVLNQFCQFKEEWDRRFNMTHEKEIEKEAEEQIKEEIKAEELRKKEEELKKINKE